MFLDGLLTDLWNLIDVFVDFFAAMAISKESLSDKSSLENDCKEISVFTELLTWVENNH